MSKTIKNMMMRDYKNRMGSAEEAMVIGVRGLKAVDTTNVRTKLRKKNIKVTVVRNSLVRKMFEGGKMSPLGPSLTGATALVYSPVGASIVEVAREVVAIAKDYPAIELRAAVLDGTLFSGKSAVEDLSKFPTKIEAQGQVVSAVVGPARKVAAQVKGPGSNIAGLIKAIEAKLEKGEAIVAKA
jgi:large subunit ribosomal protein L10